MAASREFEFDPTTTMIDAIQRAVYRLSDRLSADIRDGDPITCTVHFSDDEDPDEVSAAFRNEVLDQVLRERIRGETEASRNLILSLAFSRAGVIDDS
jgi:His-Xaa-Ser system protein HxsD